MTLPKERPDKGDQFAALYSGWLEARSKIERLIIDESAPDLDERFSKLSEVADDFARRAGAMPGSDFPRLLAKLELLAHYLGDGEPGRPGNPQFIVLAGIRADVLSLRSDNARELREPRARIVTAIAARGFRHAVARHG